MPEIWFRELAFLLAGDLAEEVPLNPAQAKRLQVVVVYPESVGVYHDVREYCQGRRSRVDHIASVNDRVTGRLWQFRTCWRHRS